MKVNDPNLQGPSGLGSTGVSKPTQTGRSGTPGGTVTPGGDSGDGVELSGLARSLRTLDVDSPERQAKVDALTKAFAQGTYQADAEATAGGIIQDALDNQ